MGRKEQVKRSAEEKWEILQEGLKSGNIAETCRKQLEIEILKNVLGESVAAQRTPRHANC